MKIENNKVVSIDYVLKDKDGNLLDSSSKAGPLEYLHGHQNLIKGLEDQLTGKSKGDKFNAVVEPKDAYGEYDEKLVVEVPRNQFDPDLKIEIGMTFQGQTEDGGYTIVHVTKVTDDKITVDANHELAGKTLYFDVEVKDIRDATEEEIAYGGLHRGGCGGCGGGCGGCGGGCGGDEGCGGGCGDNGGCGSCGC